MIRRDKGFDTEFTKNLHKVHKVKVDCFLRVILFLEQFNAYKISAGNMKH